MNAYCCPARDVCFFMPQTIWLFISCVFSLICIRAACSHLWLHAHTKTMRVYPSGFCFLFLQWRKTSCPEDPPAWAGLRAFTPDDDFCSSLQERDGMRAILESYDSELTPAEHSPQLNRRMREAEEMVQKLHAHNSELEVIKQHPSLTPEGEQPRPFKTELPSSVLCRRQVCKMQIWECQRHWDPPRGVGDSLQCVQQGSPAGCVTKGVLTRPLLRAFGGVKNLSAVTLLFVALGLKAPEHQ